MENKKVLLRVRGLKQYFPLKRNKKLFVKANDGISLDIYEGETFGLVGESGCGKSTLGRVILQLYRQTAGEVIYYGAKVYSVSPRYYMQTLKKLAEQGASLGSLKQSGEALVAECASVIGGLLVSNDINEIAKTYMALCQASKDCRDLEHSTRSLSFALDSAESASEKEDLGAKIRSQERRIAEKKAQMAVIEVELDKQRQAHKDKEGFEQYESLRDEGIDLAKLNYNEMRSLRSELQLIFQDPYSSLNPRMTVGNIIGEGLKAHNFFSRESKAYSEYITDVMENCGLAAYMIHRYPHQFSGGQRQRIGIARTLAVKPKFVVCDEAVSALDVSIQSQILNLLQDLKEKEKLTYLFISHDLSVVKYLSDRIGVMYLGNLVELATTEDLFTRPSHPYTEALLTAIPTTDVNESLANRDLLEGDIPSPINPPSGCKFHTRCKYAQDVCKSEIPEFADIGGNHLVACHICTGKVRK